MKSLEKIVSFFVADPIEAGAQRLSSEEIVSRMNNAGNASGGGSPYASIFGELLFPEKKPFKISVKQRENGRIVKG